MWSVMLASVSSMIAASFLTIIFKQMVWDIFNSRIGLERYYFTLAFCFLHTKYSGRLKIAFQTA